MAEGLLLGAAREPAGLSRTMRARRELDRENVTGAEQAA